MLSRVITPLLFINVASISYAVSDCDRLAALEADPLSISVPVKFVDLNAEKEKRFNACKKQFHLGTFR